MSDELETLLLRAGAKRPTGGGRRWVCPLCGHASVWVNLDRLLFSCSRRGCRFFGSLESLRAMFPTIKDEVNHAENR